METLERTREALAAYGNYYTKFNRSQSRLHYFLELIKKFQILDRQPSSRNNNSLLSSQSFEALRKNISVANKLCTF